MLVMGVASPYWMRAINGAVSNLADTAAHTVSSLETR
jgi:NADH-quinone oxidoreductase subunit M